MVLQSRPSPTAATIVVAVNNVAAPCPFYDDCLTVTTTTSSS
jgi:hypothetical protein